MYRSHLVLLSSEVVLEVSGTLKDQYLGQLSPYEYAEGKTKYGLTCVSCIALTFPVGYIMNTEMSFLALRP